jgi:predicted NBD/HSP70 family sugar kinase
VVPRPSPTPDAVRGSGSRQSSLREANLALVVRTVLGAATPPSRAAVAQRTALTRSTVSRLVDDLVLAGVLAELDPPAVTGPGRPATPLVAGRGIAALGLQVNATFVAARVVDLRGEVVAELVEPGDLVGSRPRPVLRRLSRLASRVLAGVPDDLVLAGAGVALPGIVDSGTGRLLLAPNLGWSDVDVAALLDLPDGVDAPVHVGNEADLAAHAVAEPAPGRPGALADFVYVSGETGIGGAVVLDGRVMRGRHGWAGEIGHVCVDPDGPPCPCGSTGCLERYAGRRALLAAAGLPAAAPTDVLAERARSGDRAALQALSGAARALSVALAGVVNVVDIPAIVLGGHLGLVGDLLREELEDGLRRRALSARWTPPTIRTADPDVAAGATGAALRELSAVVAAPGRWTA